MLFLFCVALWFLLRCVSCLVLPCSWFSCFFLFFFSVLSDHLAFGKREPVYVLLVHLFVYFARVNFCHFFLMSGVGCDL